MKPFLARLCVIYRYIALEGFSNSHTKRHKHTCIQKHTQTAARTLIDKHKNVYVFTKCAPEGGSAP